MDCSTDDKPPCGLVPVDFPEVGEKVWVEVTVSMAFNRDTCVQVEAGDTRNRQSFWVLTDKVLRRATREERA